MALGPFVVRKHCFIKDSLQLAFAEALPFPDEPGEGPGEKWTGRVTH